MFLVLFMFKMYISKLILFEMFSVLAISIFINSESYIKFC